jgi:hypothetical protein
MARATCRHAAARGPGARIRIIDLSSRNLANGVVAADDEGSAIGEESGSMTVPGGDECACGSPTSGSRIVAFCSGGASAAVRVLYQPVKQRSI